MSTNFESLPGDDGDDVAKADDKKSFDKSGLTNDPGQTQEEHHTPDVQKASHEHSFKPNQVILIN